MHRLYQVDEAGAQSVWNAGLFRNYVLKIRAKNERYQDQDRVKCSILDVSPVNYKEESSLLIEEIRKYGIEA
jgi:replication factor A1